jgi:hypothetical protein
MYNPNPMISPFANAPVSPLQMGPNVPPMVSPMEYHHMHLHHVHPVVAPVHCFPHRGINSMAFILVLYVLLVIILRVC